MPVCIEVSRELAETVLRELRKQGLLDDLHLVQRRDSSVLIPVKENPGSQVRIGEYIFTAVECSVPEKKKTSVKLPSLDVIGDVVIIRENVLGLWDTSELINAIRQVYPRVKSIWIKELTVDEYRKPVLRLLWGEEKREVVAKEHGLQFKVKLGEVYFNPRLSEEHHRLAEATKSGEVVVDAFTGIGGFAIHIASLKTSLVIANDANPVAYKLLVENIELNKKKLKGTVIPLNMDARELPFILREGLADRVIADLPMWSTEFADVYNKLLKPGGILHLYRLSRDEYLLLEELENAFSNWEILECRIVMEYAPRTGIFRCDLVKSKHV